MSARKNRGLKERIYLLNAEYNDNTWNLEVKASSKRIYKIKLDNTCAKCSCIDFKVRKKVCKHMYFILARIINFNNINEVQDISDNIENISNLLKEKLSNVIIDNDNNDNNNYQYDKNDNCCICFEEFGDESLEQCKSTCNNFFHTECINLWLTQNNNCPLCRTSWNSPNKVNIDVFEDFKGLKIK